MQTNALVIFNISWILYLGLLVVRGAAIADFVA